MVFRNIKFVLCYLIVTKQVNYYRAGRYEDDTCRALPSCHGVKGSSAHIFWDCLKASACWSKLLRHWTGVTVAHPGDTGLLLGCVTRRAPAYRHGSVFDCFYVFKSIARLGSRAGSSFGFSCVPSASCTYGASGSTQCCEECRPPR